MLTVRRVSISSPAACIFSDNNLKFVVETSFFLPCPLFCHWFKHNLICTCWKHISIWKWTMHFVLQLLQVKLNISLKWIEHSLSNQVKETGQKVFLPLLHALFIKSIFSFIIESREIKLLKYCNQFNIRKVLSIWSYFLNYYFMKHHNIKSSFDKN